MQKKGLYTNIFQYSANTLQLHKYFMNWYYIHFSKSNDHQIRSIRRDKNSILLLSCFRFPESPYPYED